MLTQVYGEDLNSVLFSRVFSTIGITNDMLVWRENSYRPDMLNGVKRREISSGIQANVDAMARIGYLFLRDGVWDGAARAVGIFRRARAHAAPGDCRCDQR